MEAQALELAVRELPPPKPGLAHRPARVVVVEDDADMRNLVSWVLRDDGFEVVEAEDGVGLLRCLQTSIWSEGRARIDAIVSDIQMPDLTALEVMRSVPQRDAAAPVVLITAYGPSRARTKAEALGAVAVLEKPLDWDALREAVTRAVAIGRARR